jgi:hypothetical protein
LDQKSIYDEFVSTSQRRLAPAHARPTQPARQGFGAQPNSIFIDKGTSICGIDPVSFRPMDIELSNYYGTAVDMGAYEYVQPSGLKQISPLSPRLKASPNPCLYDCLVEMEFAEKGSAELLVFDLAGKKRYTLKIDQVMAGEKRRLRLDLPLPAGVYQLVLLNGKTREMLKLIKL